MCLFISSMRSRPRERYALRLFCGRFERSERAYEWLTVVSYLFSSKRGTLEDSILGIAVTQRWGGTLFGDRMGNSRGAIERGDSSGWGAGRVAGWHTEWFVNTGGA